MAASRLESRSGFRLAVAVVTAVAVVSATPRLTANHPVFVEGNTCANNVPGTTTVPPGSCGDYDGDGLIGTAEDVDNGTDRIFGTLNAAIAGGNGGANHNGRIVVVTSGRFPEVVTLTGNLTLEGAPGVEVTIDAVVQGAPDNNPRMLLAGLTVDAPSNRYVVLRNLVLRNWTEGIQVRGDSRVIIDNCRLENNTNAGIRVVGNARVAIGNTQVNATGYRLNPAVGDFPSPDLPRPGAGIIFEGSASGLVTSTAILGSAGPGVLNVSSQRIEIQNLSLFDNNPNLAGSFRTASVDGQ
jgi:parallel beta-helix repeat protein